MPAPSTIITTATSQTLAAEPGPGGSKIPVSGLVVAGNVVTAANPLPVGGELSIAEADLTAITGSIDALAADIDNINVTELAAAAVTFTSSLYPNLTAAPYSDDIDTGADLAESLNEHVGRISDLEATVDTPTTGLAARVAELLDAVDDLQTLVAGQASDIATLQSDVDALEAYNVSNP